MKTPWEQVKESRSQRQEKRTGKKPGARQQINSGRTWSSKGDATWDSPIGRLLIDNKDTEDFSYRITEDDWDKLKKQANQTPPGCQPGLQIDIRNLRLLVIEEATYDEIVKYILMLESRLENAGE
jgi:hypothetical protein